MNKIWSVVNEKKVSHSYKISILYCKPGYLNKINSLKSKLFLVFC